jgi:aryl-alcohol dehydrogenase-like predicted oxidoreductase
MTFAIGPATIKLGDLEVRRLGFGAMRLPGPMVWGEPNDPERARAVVRRVVELGINLIDSSWYYGPDVAHQLIAEVLHPYPSDLVIACKLGGMRRPDKSWGPALRPDELRAGCDRDLRMLRLERIDVCHLRVIGGSDVPFMESLDAMIDLQREGKIRHLALSNVTVEQLDRAVARTPIVAVQNLFHSGGGASEARLTHAIAGEDVLDRCTTLGIPFLPFFPLAMGKLGNHPALAAVAERHRATAAQLALAWLLARSPVILPIPGTSSVAHLDENWAARTIALTADDAAEIAAVARSEQRSDAS